MGSTGRALNVLIIGCGNIAGGFDANRDASLPPLTHAGAFSRNPGFRIAGCVEPDEARRNSFMAQWRAPVGAAGVEELDARGHTFDVISVCSPTALHSKHIAQALALQPSLVFCEKPLGPNVAEASDLVRRCNDAGVLLAVNHNRRWDSAVFQLKCELARGEWGALRSATGYYNKGVLNNGSHLVDLLHYLVGPLALVHAGTPIHDSWPQDPSIPALLATEAGAPIMLNCGHAEDYSLFELQLVLERGIVAMEDGGLRWRRRRTAPSPEFSGYTALEAGSQDEGSYLRTMSNAVANIYDAVTTGAQLASTGDTALYAQRVCTQISEQAWRPTMK